MESDYGRVDGPNFEELKNRCNVENSGVQLRGADKIANLEADSVIGGGDGGENKVALSCPVGETPQMPGGVVGTGTRKRTIVRKTIRVVKKLIKKRVPKRNLMNGLGNRGEELKVEAGVHSGEVINGGNLANDVIGKYNLVDEVIRETDSVTEAKDTANAADDLTENLNFENCSHRVKETTSIVQDDVEKADIRPVAGDEIDNLSAQVESGMSKPDILANYSEQMVPRNDESGLNTMTADGVEGNGAICELERKGLTKPFCDVKRKDLIEVEKVNFAPGTTRETNDIKTTMIENQLKDCLMKNQRIDISREPDMVLISAQNVGSAGEESGVLGGREDERSITQAESCSGEVNSNCIKLSEGLLLSGEMEALERKKKRKREIFLGGLDMYAKEEDIREVFKDVGSIEEVRVVKNPKSKKNRGYAFVRFATAADAEKALAKCSKVEVCGKRCNAAPVEGNDTIFLSNIDRNWKTEDVLKLLEKAGIKKIDKVTLKVDPNNTERNRGFAFVELQTSKDAQTAFKKLQKKDAFGIKKVVKVAWAQPLIEPAEEEILLVKSVYAEYLPSSWNEEKVKEYFKRFGEIESVTLAKDLPSSRRQDFAFINYTTRDAALTCIETVNRERLEDDHSKVKIAVSLAKPIPKRKQIRQTSNPIRRQHLEEKANGFQTSKQLHGPRNKGKAVSSSYDHVKVDSRPSTTDELLQLLRQQASTMHDPPHPGSGASMPDHHFLLPGIKRPFSQVGHDALYVEHQGLSRAHAENSYQISDSSALSHGTDLLLSPFHHQRGPGLPYESINGRITYLRHFKARDRYSFYEDTNPYYRH